MGDGVSRGQYKQAYRVVAIPPLFVIQEAIKPSEIVVQPALTLEQVSMFGLVEKVSARDAAVTCTRLASAFIGSALEEQRAEIDAALNGGREIVYMLMVPAMTTMVQDGRNHVVVTQLRIFAQAETPQEAAAKAQAQFNGHPSLTIEWSALTWTEFVAQGA